MYFFKNTSGNWVLGSEPTSFTSKAPCTLRRDTPTVVTVRTIEKRVLLIDRTDVTAIKKNAEGDFYANYAEFVDAVSDFFDNAPITAEEVDAKIGAEVDILSDRIDTVEGIANAASSGSLGSIKPTDAAPTPGRNGNYTFSIGGAKPAWLTAEAGITTVKAGDGVAVVYAAPSSYTYTHINVAFGVEQVRSQSTGNVPSSKLFNTNMYQLDNVIKKITGAEQKLLLSTVAYSAGTNQLYFTLNEQKYAGNTFRFLIKSDVDLGQSIINLSTYQDTTSKETIIAPVPQIIYDPNLSNGIIVEFTATKNFNKIKFGVFNSTISGNVSIYLIKNIGEFIDENETKLTFTNKSVLYDRVLDIHDFCRYGSYSFSDGSFSVGTSKRYAPILEIGLSKKITIPASSGLIWIFEYTATDQAPDVPVFTGIKSLTSAGGIVYCTTGTKYIAIVHQNQVKEAEAGVIIHDSNKKYDLNGADKIAIADTCNKNEFTYSEFFNEDNYANYDYSVKTSSTTFKMRDMLDVSGLYGIVTTANLLVKVYQYSANDLNKCIRAHTVNTSESLSWYGRKLIIFHPDTKYIRVISNNSYKSNVILLKKQTITLPQLDVFKYRLNSRIQTWKACGDSITDQNWAGAGEVSYWNVASRILGIVGTNNAKAGSRFCYNDDVISTIRNKTKNLVGETGIITMLGGTNDYNQGPKGVWGDVGTGSSLISKGVNGVADFATLMYKSFSNIRNPETTVGISFEEAFLYTMWEMKRNNPKALIICLLPIGRIGEDTPNTNGYTLNDYREVERTICKRLAIPVIDLTYAVGGVNDVFYFNETSTTIQTNYDVMAEGLHPNNIGHRYLAAYLIPELVRLIDTNDLLNQGLIEIASSMGLTISSNYVLHAKEKISLP